MRWRLSAPGYHGPVSDHFDGRRFMNVTRTIHAKRGDIARWLMTRRPTPWKPVLDQVPGPPPPRRIFGNQLRVTWIGHATALIQTGGMNVLTDPIWSDRCSPVSFAGPRRVRAPGIRFEDPPSIDVVLISHNHYDHLDESTLRQLNASHRPTFVVPLGNAALLRSFGLSEIVELDWWKRVGLLGGISAHCVPAQHFSGRGLADRDATLWGGFVLETPGGAVYFAGDTGMGPQFRQIRERFGQPRLALLPIGAYEPAWFMQSVHISPVEAVSAHQQLGASRSVAIHYGTFPLADDARDEAPAALTRALLESGVSTQEFWTLGFGEGRDVPQAATLRTIVEA